ARYIGKILAKQLIRQAAVAHLILRVFGIVGAHAAAQSVSDVRGGTAADFLNVILAVEQVRVNPLTPALEQAAVLVCRLAVPEGPRHLFASAKSAEIVNAAKRIGAIEFHVVGVVLN